MEESSLAKELEVFIDFWISGSLHLLPRRFTSPGAVLCFLLEHKAVVIVEVLSVCSLLQHSIILHTLGLLFTRSPRFLTSQSFRGSAAGYVVFLSVAHHNLVGVTEKVSLCKAAN